MAGNQRAAACSSGGDDSNTIPNPVGVAKIQSGSPLITMAFEVMPNSNLNQYQQNNPRWGRM